MMTRSSQRTEMILAVTYHGLAYVVQAPAEAMAFADGSCCDDNNFKHVPDRPGVYRCVVYHNFTVTTDYEGIEECDEDFNVVSSELIDLSRKDA